MAVLVLHDNTKAGKELGACIEALVYAKGIKRVSVTIPSDASLNAYQSVTTVFNCCADAVTMLPCAAAVYTIELQENGAYALTHDLSGNGQRRALTRYGHLPELIPEVLQRLERRVA